MSQTTPALQKKIGLRRRSAFVLGESFAPLAAVFDAVLIVGLSVAAGVAYHLYVYNEPGVIVDFVRVGLLSAFFYVTPRALQKHYEIAETAADPAGIRRIFNYWNIAIFCVLAVGFVSKLADDYSRGAVILFYFAGLVGLSVFRTATVSFVRRGFRRGWLASKRIFLIGPDSRVRAFRELLAPSEYGLQLEGVAILPEMEKNEPQSEFSRRFRLALDRAVEHARRLKLDNIVLLLPWSDNSGIQVCREAFLKVPAATVLGPEQELGRALEAGMCRIGPTTGLNLVRAPLSAAETFAKRCMDLLIASVALVVLAPLLLLIGGLIKLNTRGPVFFRQYRHGFNQEPFRILKFRTMTVAEDGADFRQAAVNDPRVTRLGRFLRRWNLDELPQIVNVIRGEMSIVGPRPHALIHNQEFQNRIALYARRHNVKPGITGWAQVNGYRGVTDTEEKMSARVAHDLYYIDNWSLWFDVQIILMTLFSPKALRNAH